MSEYQRILLATDLSASSRGAEDSALSLGRSLGAEVVVLHAVELPAGLDPRVRIHPEPGGPAVSLGAYVSAADAGALESLCARFRAAGVPVSASIELGPIAATILERARAARADLIVVGTHGRTGLRRAVLGSVAERLVRTAPVPVLVVRREGAESIPEADEQARVEAEG